MTHTDYILRLFKYFAQFIPKTVLQDLLVQPEHSSEEGYAEAKAELLLPSERIINELAGYICSSNPDFVADRIRNAKGFTLFIEYGTFRTNPSGEYGVEKKLAITIAHSFTHTNNDNLNESLLMNKCQNLLNHILITLEHDQLYNNGCGFIGKVSFPADASPIMSEEFYGQVGWTAFLSVDETMVYDPLNTPWPDPAGHTPASVIEQNIKELNNRVKFLEDNPPPTITLDNEVTEAGTNAVTGAGVWAALTSLWNSFTEALGLHTNAQSDAHPISAVTNLNTYLADLSDSAHPITITSLSFEITDDDEATITAVASGGLGTLTYSLYDGATLIESNTTGVFIVTEEKTYTVKVNDEVESTEASDTVAVAFFDADFVVFADRLTTPLSSQEKLNLNKLFTSLKSAIEITTLADFYYQILLYSGETLEASLKNLVKPANDAIRGNAITWAQFIGFTGNDSNMYVDTNINLNAEGVNKDNISVIIGCRNLGTIASGRFLFGAISGDGYVTRTSGGGNTRLNSITANILNNEVGYIGISRNNSASYVNHLNKNAGATITQPSTATPTCNIYDFAYSNNNSLPTASAFSSAQIAVKLVCKAVTQNQYNAIIDAFETYFANHGTKLLP